MTENGDLSKEKLVGELLALRRRVAELEGEVEEGTAELRTAYERLHSELAQREELERVLLQAQKMESVGRLAGALAHDFNNVLTLIMGFAQLMRSALPSGQGLESTVLGIQRAAESTARLTHQLLAYSRTLITDPVVVSLNDPTLNMDGLLRHLIGEAVELVTLPAPDLGMVMVDPAQIEQVLMNLAANARDAMPDGGKLIIETANVTLDEEYVRLHPEATSAGEYVVLIVSDTGVGMAAEVRARVFEPFFTTKSAGRGTGLGLSTCYGIVAQLGGHIEVEGDLGVGTTFRIYLPRVYQPASAPTYRDEPVHLPAGDETVLLVEDEPLVRQYAAGALRKQGYTVLEAGNGHEALSVTQKRGGQKIHLLLTDVVMPLMSGKELAAQVTEVQPGVKVLYTSGYTDAQMVRQGALGEGAEFVQKPFTPAMLANKIREVLEQ